MSSNFKENHSSIFTKVGMNRQWAADIVHGAVTEGVNGTYGAAESFWNNDGQGFQKSAGVVSGAINAGILGFGLVAPIVIAEKGGSVFSGNSYRRMFSGLKNEALSFFSGGRLGQTAFTEYEAVVHNGKTFFSNGAGGAFTEFNPKPLGTAVSALHESDYVGAALKRGEMAREGVAAGKLGKSGVWRFATKAGEESGYFVKGSRLMSWKGIGWAALAIGATMAVDSTAGLAGKILDEAHTAYTQSKFHTYDTREFNNRSMQQWGYNKQNQVMSNVMAYEQNNMSLARLYYSR